MAKHLPFLGLIFLLSNFGAGWLDGQFFLSEDLETWENILGFNAESLDTGSPWTWAVAGPKWITTTIPKWIMFDYDFLTGGWVIVRVFCIATFGVMGVAAMLGVFIQAGRGLIGTITGIGR